MVKNFSNKQLEILAFPNSEYDALICDGSIRAGKTSVMSVAFILWAMRDFNNCNFGICSKTIGTAERNIIKPLLSMTYLNKRFGIKYHRSNNLEIVGNGHKNTFYIYGGKDGSSYQLIQGITLAGVLLDEVALMPKSFVEQALARCSVSGRKLWFNCNPEGNMHWFYQNWVLEPEKHNALRLHFTMDDNPSLSEKIKEDYKSMYTGVFYNRYILGLWVAAEGVIYDMFDSEKHILKEIPALEGDVIISADFGIQNATVFLKWQKEAGKDRWICTKEWYYSGRESMRQKTVSELADGLDSICDDRPRQVIVDPSASALITELRRRGYRVMPAQNDVIQGIADVSTMLYQDRLAFHESCTNTIMEFGVYAWDKKASEHGDDKPVKENDHAMDAVRYMVNTKHLAKKTKTKYISPLTG